MILDPFLGGGTTAVVCKRLKRNCIGFEIDKETFDIAEDRVRKTDTLEEYEQMVMHQVKLQKSMN